MNSKILALNFVGKVKKILKETEEKVKELTKDKTLENPIESDVVVSIRANAYDAILKEYKDFVKKKKEAESENE